MPIVLSGYGCGCGYRCPEDISDRTCHSCRVFVDVTVKAQRPKTRFRFIIGSAHCAKLYEALPDADFTLHFNSYFKVMDIYEKNGFTQIFLLHIPYMAVPVFKSEHSFNFIQGMTETNLVEIVRRSLNEKLQMDVFADTSEEELLERMKQPVGLDNSGNPVPMGYMPIPEEYKGISDTVRTLANDLDPINYPDSWHE